MPLRELLTRQTADLLRHRGVDEPTIATVVAAQAEELTLVCDPEVGGEELS